MPKNLATWIARRVLKWAVLLYPAEKRAWGEAILAESALATETGVALSWMLGGLMVAFRAYFSRRLRRKSASSELAFIGPAQLPPPVPWKIAVICVAISGALLFVPDLRQALSVTYSSWTDEFVPRDETAWWEKIAREAEIKGDAPAMAFAAMRLPDAEGARFDEAVRLAGCATAKDPSLTWIYYFLVRRSEDTRFHASSPHPELTERLQHWDPQNAVPYLLAADEIVHAHRGDPQWRGLPGFTFDAPFRQEDIARIRGRGPQWREPMDRAFAAQVYDAYFTRRLQLDLDVMQRFGVLDPQLAAGTYLYSWWPPPLGNLREYAALRFAEGNVAEQSGQWENAAADYWFIAQFGQRMRLGAKGDAETANARTLQEVAYKHLQPVLLKLGRVQESQTVAYAAQLQNAENNETRVHGNSQRQRLFTIYFANGLLVHYCAIVFEASGLLMAVLLLTFALRRAPRFARLGITYAPIVLVLSSAGLLWAYHPYAEYYRSYLANPAATDEESILNVIILSRIPQYASGWNFLAQWPIYLWWAIITIGGAICIWLVSRTLRHRPV